MADVIEKKSGNEPQSYLETPTVKPSARERSVFAGLRVSLMPAELSGSATADPRRALIIFGIVIIAEMLLIAGAYLALIGVTNQRVAAQSSLKTELATLRSQTPALEAQATKAAQFSAQYEANRVSLDQHLYWTSFFAGLEKFILPSIHCVMFSGNAISGTVNMDCRGRNYRDVAEQVVYMRTNPQMIEMRTNSASAAMDDRGVPITTSFTMNLKFKPTSWRATEAGKMPSAFSAATSTTGVETIKTIIMPVTGSAPVQLENLVPATSTAFTP